MSCQSPITSDPEILISRNVLPLLRDVPYSDCLCCSYRAKDLSNYFSSYSYWTCSSSLSFFSLNFRDGSFRRRLICNLVFGLSGLKKQSLVLWPGREHKSQTFAELASAALSRTVPEFSVCVSSMSRLLTDSHFRSASCKVLISAVTGASSDACIDATRIQTDSVSSSFVPIPCCCSKRFGPVGDVLRYVFASWGIFYLHQLNNFWNSVCRWFQFAS